MLLQQYIIILLYYNKKLEYEALVLATQYSEFAHASAQSAP